MTLGIQNIIRRNISAPLMNHFQVDKSKEEVGNWELIDLKLDGQKSRIYALPAANYDDGSLHFYGQGISFVKEIFELLTYEKGISIAHSSVNKKYYLLMKQRKSEFPSLLFQSENLEDCVLKKDQLLVKISELDLQSEGFHMVENILLRPLESVSYLFSFVDTDGEEFIEGLYASDMESQRSLGEDILGFGLQIDNYSIVEDESSLTYSILIYNFSHEPVARLRNNYSSKPGAKKAIDQAIQFFQDIRNRSIVPETVMGVNVVGGVGNSFPVDFQFSDTLSFIFPEWPVRFQKSDFVNYLHDLISENILAHQSAKVYFVNVVDLYNFESLYYEWLFLKNQDQLDLKKIDVLSLQLIQLLRSFKEVYSTIHHG